ncbi:metal-dependent transcriptional regulator [Alkaliflexus imshenetskii]|uniref:metal-dependent transcriptional regulator n=1 Tax=Alkaliflexus imshenetskii TaxID=286730 RepID=UPI00047C911D|nr:metal-dependent transcriptional regulator [Alkaliflexus imshenetskii]
MSASVDNFLKTIYLISNEVQGVVTGTLIASRLNISAAAVTDMTRKLATRGLVNYTPYREIGLTTTGEQQALKIVRRHRLWELFLHETLGMDLKEVHDEAERLEHHASDRLIDCIEQFLAHPRFDPHGEPIPDKNGMLTQIKDAIELIDATPDEDYIICSIRIQKSEVFDIFTHYDIRPGKHIKVVRRFDFDNSLEVQINNQNILLSNTLACKILCTKN